MTIWKPRVTVAAVIERAGKYLLVEEEPEPGAGLFINQPAGHLDPGESIIQGVIRETLEETAYTLVPDYVLGIYQWHSQRVNATYLRFAFVGHVTCHDPGRILDTGIVRADWFDVDEINRQSERHRSPLVMQCIRDHQAGIRYPLSLLTHYES
ncbi:MAG: NUDIX hydrolase [Nitrosomonas sp.]|nr:MAG: NUDIX hydrolase [Nitrosomonas sp.]